MAAAAAATSDYTAAVLDALETMRRGELALGGPQARFKALAYNKAMNSIRRLGRPIRTVTDVEGLEGVGAKIRDKIAEVLATGRLAAADAMRAATSVDALDVLLGVHGIGPVKARELLAAGYRTIDDLRVGVERDEGLLNDTQKLGLKHYEDGRLRIPRDEMTAHEAHLLSSLPRGLLQGLIVGSYRRGAASSGDIDMLLTEANDGVTAAAAGRAFAAFVAVLEASGYIVDTLASGAKKWLGYVRLGDGRVRRLDLLLTPRAEYPFAVLYFTGSDKFNIAFRGHCGKLGYTLNEHRIAAVAGGVPIPAAGSIVDERDIFAFVGLRYVPPTERVDSAQIVEGL
jgi:DNA polymerase/3'-5' exonuclease PolX